MALVVMGKQIAQQWVLNPQRPLKLVKQPIPAAMPGLPPTPGAWDGELAAHRAVAHTIVQLEATVNTYTRALERVEEDDYGPQTA
jgi:hypothetical protein